MRKIAILGTTPSRASAPIDDKDWEIWTIGPGGMEAHRWDRLFEMHTVWPEDFKEYLDKLSNEKRPVYTVVPMSTRIQQWAEGLGKDTEWLAKTITGDWSSNIVIDRDVLFQKYRRMWFSSSISYCIALAIGEGATDIGCFGIDLESGEEYLAQHAGAAYFLDIAKLLGINIHLPDGACGLMRDLNPYPDRYETNLALTLEKKKAWIEQLIQNAEAGLEQAKIEFARGEGQLLLMRDQEALKKQIDKGPKGLQELEENLMRAQHNLRQQEAQLHHLKGEKSSTEYWQRSFVHGFNDPEKRS